MEKLNDDEKIEMTLAAAKAAIEDKRMAEALEILFKAHGLCGDPYKRRLLFGNTGAPSNPGGIAGLADEYHYRDVDTTWVLLDFIEQNEGTGKGLCEVWFSTVVRALELGRFEQGRIAFTRCLRSQAELGPDSYRDFRLTPNHLLEAAIKQAVKDFDANNYINVLGSLEVLLNFATLSISKDAIKQAIVQIEECQRNQSQAEAYSMEARKQLFKVLELRKL